MDELYDIAFVGSGVSCAYTLVCFLKLMEKEPPGKIYKLVFIDKDDEFWTGIAYGKRSGFNSLVITSLKYFIPPDEREYFTVWLKKNSPAVLDSFKQRNGFLTKSWLSKYEAAISNHEWEEVYVPRYVFGLFIKDRVTQLLRAAEINGTIQYQLLNANVQSINKHDKTYTINSEIESNRTIIAQKVVLGIGSPPVNSAINIYCKNTNHPPVGLVNDIYHPSIEDNINKIGKLLLKKHLPDTNKVLIVGSNASALEVLYNLIDCYGFDIPVYKFYVISSSGAFPGLINEQGHLSAFQPANLASLKPNQSYTPETIYTAIKKDIETAIENKISVDDTYHPISKLLMELVSTLKDEHKKQFVEEYGNKIGKLQRRAGADYLGVTEKLMEQGRLEFIKGRLMKFSPHCDDRIEIEYANTINNEVKTHSAKFDMVINCTGSSNLKDTKSNLIAELIKNNVCKINSSGNGLLVNERFEANENLFVMGPLLAGNIIGETMAWHVESCSRIMSLSCKLAPHLI